MKIRHSSPGSIRENNPPIAAGAPTLIPPGTRVPESSMAQFQSQTEADSSRPTQEPPEIAQRGAESELRLTFDETAARSPIAEESRARGDRSARGTSDDIFGAFSLETFASAGGLTYTHEDAQGWYNYLDKFHTPNFWYRDGGVKPWAYYEDYDNWQDTYGMDAVLAVYHSGHGTMDSAGVFYAPLGADWGGLGTWARSDRMRLGNEQVNYIFWSTCLSCRVLGGHSPIRTWSAANKGFRMLFGFETVSWDNPNYGKFFWEEWNKNQSLSSAWMNASWRIAHDQAPSVVACGATADEARNRVFNERMLSWPHVSSNYWHWRWYYASSASASTTVSARRPHLAVPRQILAARLQPPQVNAQRISSLIEQLGLEIRASESIAAPQGGIFLIDEGDAHLAVSADGSFDAQFARPNLENKDQIAVQRAISIASEFVRRIELDADVEVAFDVVRLGAEASATERGSGHVEGPFITETTVQFKQLINGIPVVTPGQGELRVSVDNDGQITSAHSSARCMDRLIERSTASAGPTARGSTNITGPTEAPSYEQQLHAQWGKHLTAAALKGPIPTSFTTVPGSTEIGYTIRGNEAILVAQRAIEVDFGHGLKKRYWITAPLSE